MSTTTRSVKDIAFARECAKYRTQIRILKRQLSEKDDRIQELNNSCRELQVHITEQDDWICRLLEYTELNEEDMRSLIKRQRRS